ncbi:MAG: hypothetical protein AB7S99_00040 [Pseudodonghicola sp.]
MLRDAMLVPGIENRIDFSGPHGFVRLLNADASHFLLNMRFSAPEGRLFLNTQADGVWGAPRELPLAEGSEQATVFFRLTDVLEIRNAEHSLRFERFDAETGRQVRYSVFKNAGNPGETLKLSVPRPEEMAAQIASQVALRRLDMLERQLQGQRPGQAQAPNRDGAGIAPAES